MTAQHCGQRAAADGVLEHHLQQVEGTYISRVAGRTMFASYNGGQSSVPRVLPSNHRSPSDDPSDDAFGRAVFLEPKRAYVYSRNRTLYCNTKLVCCLGTNQEIFLRVQSSAWYPAGLRRETGRS